MSTFTRLTTRPSRIGLKSQLPSVDVPGMEDNTKAKLARALADLRSIFPHLVAVGNVIAGLVDSLPDAKDGARMVKAQCGTCGDVWTVPQAMTGPEGYLDTCPNDPGEEPMPDGK